MKNRIISTGIVLARTDFQEADRILTLLTPDHGKLRVIAKGVRRQRSKLAGGIELFSVSDITVLPSRGELGTLISTRLQTHYASIVKDINRTMLGYDLLKRMNKLTEDAAGEEYFKLLKAAFEGLNNLELQIDLVELWFTMQLLKVTGHAPDLKTDDAGMQLEASKIYLFDFDAMAFKQQDVGPYQANHIKLMRLGYGTDSPEILKQVVGAGTLAPDVLSLTKNILKLHVRV
ncbi:DNA repair protein RecO [Candidatus Saccharibacteria bacterium]|nr:DNA repair protein RecO [Candidatus Saccharibacteria bacterium]